eukprot:TRINITY_DN39088_c0_g1_i1.p1 TRINITY_DN39088_c0_g1~~TRINITY_DN39088_c0_g1_i1.p1  ORF type:complete len:176 (-),score=22.50 TRINITY_DN39088_c0_g1_i1:162-689(-)
MCSIKKMDRGGLIRAALCLELDGGRWSELLVKTVGHNGQTANMDLMNLVALLAGSLSKVPVSVAGHSSFGTHPAVGATPFGSVEASMHGSWWDSIAKFKFHREHYWHTYLSSLAALAVGRGSGEHAPFISASVDAITISGWRRPGAKIVSPTVVGRVLEGTMRCLLYTSPSPRDS